MLYTANDNDNFLGFQPFLVFSKREVLRKRETVYGFKEYLLKKSTGIVTIGGQSREFFLSHTFHDYSSIRLGFSAV
jgi:hypothetical protein